MGSYRLDDGLSFSQIAEDVAVGSFYFDSFSRFSSTPATVIELGSLQTGWPSLFLHDFFLS
jgi:hypothetical protein